MVSLKKINQLRTEGSVNYHTTVAQTAKGLSTKHKHTALAMKSKFKFKPPALGNNLVVSTKEEVEQVDEAGPFSYGAKPPRKGTVAYNAMIKRKEQEKKTKPIEPKDQMVGIAKVLTKEEVEQVTENKFSKYIIKPVKTEPKIVRKTNPSGRTTDHVEYEVHGTVSSQKRSFKSKKEAEDYFKTVNEASPGEARSRSEYAPHPDDAHYERQSQKMKDAINLHLRRGKNYKDAVAAAQKHVKEEVVNEISTELAKSYLDKTVDPVYGMPKHGMQHRIKGIRQASVRVLKKASKNTKTN